MSRRTAILTLVVIVGLTGGCAKQEQASPAEEAWSELIEAWSGLETAEDKAALARIISPSSLTPNTADQWQEQSPTIAATKWKTPRVLSTWWHRSWNRSKIRNNDSR